MADERSKEAQKIKPGGAAVNKVANKQSTLLIGAALAAVLVLGSVAVYMNKPEKKEAVVDGGAIERLTDAAGRNPGDAEAYDELNKQVNGLQGAMSSTRTDMGEIKTLVEGLVQKIDAESNAEDSTLSDIEILMKQVGELQRQLKDQENRPPTQPRTAMAPGGPLDTTRGGGASLLPLGSTGSTGPRRRSDGSTAVGQGGGLGETITKRAQQVISLSSSAGTAALEKFDKDVNGDLTKAKEPGVFSTADYVPPNAYAPATVYVGVDAATGKQNQADPQAAAFLITGPANHVVDADGTIRTTDLSGCIVNGAARGDLSTERVFIKLQKMTCPLPNGRVAVQQVEGHVTQLGKAGVRGKIVSRVGDQLNKAMIAGGLSGLGQALGGASRGGIGIGGGGVIQEIPNAEELAIAAGGQAVAGAADTLANYYVEQAKAIEPVVAMPTGVPVELVFISGFKARPTATETVDD